MFTLLLLATLNGDLLCTLKWGGGGSFLFASYFLFVCYFFVQLWGMIRYGGFAFVFIRVSLLS